jgi:hypothetical protein
MSECKHGMKSGCVYCHAPAPPAGRGARAARPPAARPPAARPRGRGSRLSEQMNDRMTALKRRLRELRGE